ncbi:MAG: nitroreductase family protein [Bacteroidales bacterium]|nr:nitroreductase family protein [Bacteroidales bacterium]
MTTKAQNIQLPTPQKDNGKSISYCLQNRKSTKEFNDSKKLSNQQISNILWAAYGFNRPEKRTVPSAMNCQEFTLYIILAEGIYKWNDKTNELILLQKGDFRAKAGGQDYVAHASMNIVYVADYNKMGTIVASNRDVMAYADCGFIAQNVYLMCASENIGCVIRGYVDKELLSKTLNLKAEEKVILSQSVGYQK